MYPPRAKAEDINFDLRRCLPKVWHAAVRGVSLANGQFPESVNLALFACVAFMESHDRKLSHCKHSGHSIAPNIPVFLASAVSAKKSGLIDMSDHFLGGCASAPDEIKHRQIYVGEATVKAGRWDG